MLWLLTDVYAAHPNIVTLLGVLAALCVLTGLLQPSAKPAGGAAASSKPPGFAAFQRSYLLTYGIILLADWLQGTHFHALYAEHGMTDEQTGNLFLTGFLSSALFGTYIGVLVDSMGRRRGCAVYCVLEIVINALEHSSSFEVLWAGRILGGVSTSLLGCAFESWMVTAHKARDYPDELLEQTFAMSSFINGLLAVLAGILAHLLEVSLGLGPIGPFRAAIALTALALALISTWEENYGEAGGAEAGGAETGAAPSAPADNAAETAVAAAPTGGGGGGGVLSALMQAVSLMRVQPRLWMLGLVQACFEGGMFAWVSIWVPALLALQPPDQSLPCGLVFSCFMLCISAGANLYSALHPRIGAASTAAVSLALAFLSMLLPLLVPYPPSFALVMSQFCLFEVTVGALNPALAVMRAKIIPTSLQSTILTAYRLPLNALVVIGTRLGASYGWTAVCRLNAIGFACALAIHLTSIREPHATATDAPAPAPAPAASTSRPKRATTPSKQPKAAKPAAPKQRPATSPRATPERRRPVKAKAKAE